MQGEVIRSDRSPARWQHGRGPQEVLGSAQAIALHLITIYILHVYVSPRMYVAAQLFFASIYLAHQHLSPCREIMCASWGFQVGLKNPKPEAHTCITFHCRQALPEYRSSR